MSEIDEVFYFYTSHDEDGRAEIVTPDEVLAGEVEWVDEGDEF